MKKLCIPVLMTVLGFFVSPLSADLIVEYDGTSAATQSPNNGECITGINFDRGAGIAEGPGGITSFSSNGFEAGSLSDAIVLDEFLSFGFNVAPNTTVDLTDIQVDVGSTGTAGPANVYLLFDTAGDGFDPSDLLATTAVPNQSGQLTFTGLPTGLTSASGLVEFRFYFDGANSTGGRLDIGSSIGGESGSVGLQINGDIAKVPEPGSFVVLSLVGLIATRRRR